MSDKLQPEIAAVVVAAANRNGLDACLLAALVMQESAGDPFAIRHEAGYKYLWNVKTNAPYRAPSNIISATAPADFASIPPCSRDTEWIAQRTSWGLGQIMGGTARSIGFDDVFLSELCDPDIGTEYSARYLASLMKRWDEAGAVSAYNAGSPTDSNSATYTDLVLRRRDTYRAGGF